ncbi:MAG: RNA polymerase sigma factor [Muribaculaceae bacterium]|nr:RNA polymerase sigma factor [Muribaculaceae bacterium]MBQ1797781.1 RNA polymerase sigma factor [Muribaculaceae bacterium]
MKTVVSHSDLLAMLGDVERRDQGFALLMRHYGRALYWHIRRLVVNHDDAQDALQETCIKVLEGIAGFKGDEEQLASWLYKIATREALQSLRRRTRLFQSIDDLGDSLVQQLHAEASVDADEATVLFQQAILQLPTQQRLVFNMRYYDDLTHEQIAQVLGKNVGTVKTSYHYAVEKLRDYLKQHSS